jgi:spore coat protein U-like protein
MMSMYVTNFTGGVIVSTAVNQVIVWQFLLETPITIRNLSSCVFSGSAGATVNFGIYNAAGNKLIDSGALSIAITNAQLSVSIAPVVLPAGTYYFAASQSTDGGEVLAFNLYNTAAVTTVSAGGSVAKIGVAANATSLGVMPSTLGAISLATYLDNTINMPAVFFAV